MAQSVLDVIVKVRDAASAKLKQVQRNMRGVKRETKNTSSAFVQFNKTMFTTVAFIGLFTRAFTGMQRVLGEGAKLERLSEQFERTVGPKGVFFKQISNFTDNATDKFAAMESAIKLKALGIAKSSSQIAELIAQAGTASKMAGKTAGEGVRAFTKFLESGSTSQLGFLNLIAKTNPELQAYMSILRASGGVMGNVISTQERLKIGYKLLREATKGNLKGQRDLADILLHVSDSWKFLRGSIGTFIGEALGPLLDKIGDAFLKLSDFLDNIRKNHKEIVFLTKVIITATAAISGLVVVLGTVKLLLIGLSAVGIGLPVVIGLVGSLAAIFGIVTAKVDGFINKLKVFGAIFQGTYQLVKSFIFDSENFAAGIGKIDKSLADLLKEHGLFKFVKAISRGISVVLTFMKSFFNAAVDGWRRVFEALGPVGEKFIEIFSKLGEGPWSRKVIQVAQFLGHFLGTIIPEGVIKVIELVKILYNLVEMVAKLNPISLAGMVTGDVKGFSDNFDKIGDSIDRIMESAERQLDVGAALKVGPGSGGKTNIVSKFEETAPEDRTSVALEHLKSLRGEQQAMAERAFASAIATGGAGGETITREEWVSIFAQGMDRSETQNKIANKQEEVAEQPLNKSLR